LAKETSTTPTYPGFHLSRRAAVKYGLTRSEITSQGFLALSGYPAAMQIARRLNTRRRSLRFPENAVRAGQLHGMGLVDEIIDHLLGLYLRETPVLEPLLEKLGDRLGYGRLRQLLDTYRHEFLEHEDFELHPPETILLKDLLRWWLTERNEAFSPFDDLYRSPYLEGDPAMEDLLGVVGEFFASCPPFGPEREDLLTALRDPAIKHPHSIPGQLEHLLRKWGSLLGKYYIALLRGIDYIREEEKPHFAGPPPTEVFDVRKAGLEGEVERFSPDRDWMPRLVLIAKSVYVWLAQLSEIYGREIRRLDQIPDEELDRFAAWGFTGLWLIGIWERSPASRELKRRLGNPDAIASAYSLYDYVIAEELGGAPALDNLKHRAAQRGIRMASDMVPNHTGIDSRWVYEHPDWFIQTDRPPFPAYSFHGENLSTRPGVEIRIEDHYYQGTDAAVVFERRDNNSSRYIYHGNDGTDMPWNDTAQLNYLIPGVREAVLDKIVEIARQFQVIRFDAAMTLAKKHFQRLWHPEPGSGGDIPSRTAHGMSRADFDNAMPKEFWREVVDRIATEVPDTLLLAEAFWLMEGYFVRTLGMHRVYNSAFMNMLKNEENAKYRTTIKNVLDFNPEILKRYVNFMNNPDEETAVAQFGSDDKYFGVCLMMATLPGLPMFGHGQVEGLRERYGMEFAKPHLKESPNQQLIRRHEREIFPLLRKRKLFAEVTGFVLYDFVTPEGAVNENVFAYSNRFGDERALIVAHNRYESTRGRVFAAYVPAGTGEGRHPRSLGEGLGLSGRDGDFLICRECTQGLTYVYPVREIVEQGLYLELDAFKYAAFLEFHEVRDTSEKTYANLHRFLSGRGVPDLEEALRETFLQPFHERFAALAHPHAFDRLIDLTVKGRVPKRALEPFEHDYSEMLNAFSKIVGQNLNHAEILRDASRGLDILLSHDYFPRRYPTLMNAGFLELYNRITEHFRDWRHRYVIYLWSITHRLGELTGSEGAVERTLAWLDECLIMRQIEQAFRIAEFPENDIRRFTVLIRLLTAHQEWGRGDNLAEATLRFLDDVNVQFYLQVNRYRDVLWFNHELYEEMVGWLFAVSLFDADLSESDTAVLHAYNLCRGLLDAEQKSDFKVEKLLQIIFGESRE
jgi:glycosidase